MRSCGASEVRRYTPTVPRTSPLVAMILLLAVAPASLGGGWPQPPSRYGPIDPIESARGQLRLAVTRQSDGSQHALLTALRQLKDPALKPLFQSLVQADDWTMQLGGILGLAEIENRSVEPFLLEQIRDPRDRSSAIRAAVGLELLGPDEATAVLQWKSISPEDRLVVLAERLRRGGPADLDLLRSLVDHESPSVAAVAAMLLAEEGDSVALDKFPARLARLEGETRLLTIMDLARAAERHRARSMLPLLAQIASDAEGDRNAALACLAAAFAIDPSVALDLWSDCYARETSNAGRIRAAILLLASETEVPPATFDMMNGGGPVLESLGAAGRAIATGEGAPEALRAVIDGGHRLSITWAMTALLDQPPEVAAPLYESLVRSLIESRIPPPMIPVAIEACSRLVAVDPSRLRTLLEEAAVVDESMLEALLVGVLASESRTAAAEVAAPLLGRGGRRCDSLVVLAIARTDAELTPAQREVLETAAAGGGKLDPSLRVQAAWLLLRRSGRLEQELAAVFAAP